MKIAVLLLYLTAYGILSVYLVVDAAHSFHYLMWSVFSFSVAL